MNCQNCACNINNIYCTKREEMPKKECDKWQKIKPREYVIYNTKTPEEIANMKTRREERIEAKHELTPTFQKFLRSGGHHSFRTGETK